MIEAILIGFAGGVIAGMLGVGGGVLFVPGLAIFLGATQIEAEATSLLAIIPVAIVGAWRQNGYGNVRVREGLVIGALSGVGALIGVASANAVSNRVLEIGFACLCFAIAAQFIRRAIDPPDRQGAAEAPEPGMTSGR